MNKTALVVVILGFLVVMFAPGKYWLVGLILVFIGSWNFSSKKPRAQEEPGLKPEDYLRCDNCHRYMKDCGDLTERTGLYLCKECDTKRTGKYV